MNKKNKMKLPGILQEFFGDVNVRFPDHPTLVEGIDVYVAPNGLGIQFRGGAEKIVVRGRRAIVIWDIIRPLLDGNNSLDDILSIVERHQNLSVSEIAMFLKTLHCYHLLYDKNQAVEYNIGEKPIDNSQQTNFYKRIFPLIGSNKSVQQICEKIEETSILLIINQELLPIVLQCLFHSGFRNMGIILLKNREDNCLYSKNDIDLFNIMTFRVIDSYDEDEIRQLLSVLIVDYNYILPIINNPNPFFLAEIVRMCNIQNRPMLSVAIMENSYEVGPLFYPHSDTSCAICRTLRKQSFQKNSVYDYLYSKDLLGKKVLYNSEIKGFDIQAVSIVTNIAVSQIKSSTARVTRPSLINKVICFDPLSLKVSEEEVIKVSGCPFCS